MNNNIPPIPKNKPILYRQNAYYKEKNNYKLKLNYFNKILLIFKNYKYKFFIKLNNYLY